jgi:CxxC motif-containing protein
MFHLIGTHEKTADPEGFRPTVWHRERMPTVSHLEIEGRHREASGFLLEGVMQPTFTGVLLRQLLNGIHVRKRARNLLVSHCHIYNNRGVGLLLDNVNLHQAIVTGSHISYCLRGGIVISGGEIRNVQITGNDIEYNFDRSQPTSADVLLDCRAEGSSIREGTIASNTIQAKASPGGANVRLLGFKPEVNTKVGMFTISDNLIGSQEVNVHLQNCRGVVLSGNCLYSGHQRNLLVEGSSHLVATGNNCGHNPDYHERELSTGVRLVESTDCLLNSLQVQDSQAGRHTVADVKPIEREALVELVRCRRITLAGCQVLDGAPYGLLADGCDLVNVSGSTLTEQRAERLMRSAVVVRGGGTHLMTGNILGRGLDEATSIDPSARVTAANNLVTG